MENDRVKYNYYMEKLKNELIVDPELIVAAITALDFNVQQDKIIPAVYDAQRLYIEPILGSALYIKLQQTSLPYAYKILSENYVLPALIHYTMMNLIPQMSFNVAEGGVYRHYSSDSEIITESELNSRVQTERIKAEDFRGRLFEFIEQNDNYYPEYDECLPGGIPARRRDSDYLGSWYLGNPLITAEELIDGFCGDDACPGDDSMLVQHFYWGTNLETDMGFDPTTLQSSSSVQPNEVISQPTGDFFWCVGDEDFVLTQVGTVIPYVDFSNPNANAEIFVKGEQDGLFWYRVMIKETYESPVEFGIR